MYTSRKNIIVFVLFLITGILSTQIANAQVNLISNGGFELGNFTGWTVTNWATPYGNWYIDTPGTTTPVSGFATLGNPTGGSFYAVTDQSGYGSHALTQPFTISMPAASAILSFDMFANDWDAGPIINPIGLDPTGGPNQHARVDILSGGAGPFDTGAGVLANYYLGVDGGPDPNPYTHYAFDVTSVLGSAGTYQLRFAEVDNQLFFNMGVDNVRLDYTPIPEPGTFVLCGIGILGLFGYGWRRKHKA